MPTQNPLVRAGVWLAEAAERWFPDAFVFALLGVVVTFLGGLALGETPMALASAGAGSFWDLAKFTMQMAMVIIGGFVVASSPVMLRLIRRLARVPQTSRGAVAYVAAVAMLSSLLNWGLSLVFTGLLVREICARLPRVDYRAISSAAYLGLGSVWAFGLSSSAAILQASPEQIPPALMKVTGVIPLTQTIFLPQSILCCAVLLMVSIAVAYFSCPSDEQARSQSDLGIAYKPLETMVEPRQTPGEWLDYSPLLPVLVVLISLPYLWSRFAGKSPEQAVAAFDLDTFNLIFILAGLLLHGTPRSFGKAVAASVPATAGVLIQFPFYAVIFGMISKTSIGHFLGQLCVHLSTPLTFPILVAAYSAFLGMLVPSGGGKWIIEAPYVMAAASAHHIHLGWTVQIYNAAEALPNLLNPFWMLPLMGILSVRTRDLAGFSILQLLVHTPLIFLLSWALSYTLPYLPPHIP
jgi:short-chain fatty acids transporter